MISDIYIKKICYFSNKKKGSDRFTNMRSIESLLTNYFFYIPHQSNKKRWNFGFVSRIKPIILWTPHFGSCVFHSMASTILI